MQQEKKMETKHALTPGETEVHGDTNGSETVEHKECEQNPHISPSVAEVHVQRSIELLTEAVSTIVASIRSVDILKISTSLGHERIRPLSASLTRRRHETLPFIITTLDLQSAVNRDKKIELAG
jgi:hypothetical protein